MKRTLIFWFWNDVLEKDEIHRQIQGMHSRGVECFLIHPLADEFRREDFHGAMPGYLSDNYFEMVRYAVECAAELDMEVWLYDEGGWPSGMANGFIKSCRPDLMHRQITSTGEIKTDEVCPDLFSPEVIRLFLESTHEKYRKYVGEYFGTVVKCMFTDEPFFGMFSAVEGLPYALGVDLPFSPVLEERFFREKGYTAREAAMRIMNDGDADAKQDYCEIWVKLICENYMAPIRQWCHENNLKFAGHLNGDDNLCSIVWLSGGGVFQILDYFDVPGCDAIWRQIHPLSPEMDYPRLMVSAAGSRMTVSESFGVYGRDLTLAEMKYVAAMQFVCGVQIIAPMGYSYSSRDSRQVGNGSDFSGIGPCWEYYRFYSGFVRRMSKVFDRTEVVYKAWVNFPMTALQREFPAAEDIFATGRTLAERQITYGYSVEKTDIPADIEPDVVPDKPCPALRTRLLKSPRGERRILVNSGKEALHLKIAAPAGYSVWYDPADGSRRTAVAENGFFELVLPFAGAIVLLTVPGKCRCGAVETPQTAEIPLHFKRTGAVRAATASANGFTEIPVPADGREDFCGVWRYVAEVDMPQAGKAEVVFPEAVRAACTLTANGGAPVTNVWQPYRWTVDLMPGKNIIEVTISDSPAKAMYSPEHMAFLKEKGWANSYWEICSGFEVLFPDEEPLKSAFIRLI